MFSCLSEIYNSQLEDWCFLFSDWKFYDPGNRNTSFPNAIASEQYDRDSGKSALDRQPYRLSHAPGQAAGSVWRYRRRTAAVLEVKHQE